MKKWILVLLAALAVASLFAYMLYDKPSGRSSAVAQFYAFDLEARSLRLEGATSSLSFVREEGVWRIVAPFSDALEPQMAASLDAVFRRGIFTDLRRAVDHETLKLYESSGQRVVLNGPAGERRFLLGESQRQGNAEERVWAYVDGDAQFYRIFSPNIDLAALFSAPAAKWRDRAWVKLDGRRMAKIHIETGTDRMLLEKSAKPKPSGYDDWRLSELDCAHCEGIGRLEDFEVDVQSMASLLDLLAPFYVDDVADELRWDEIKGDIVGARLSVLNKDDDLLYRVSFGPELGSEEALLGLGARYVKVEFGKAEQTASDQRVGIVSMRRLAGLLPTVYDLHTKKLWDIASTLSGVIIEEAGLVRRFVPSDGDYWVEEKDVLTEDGLVEVEAIPVAHERFVPFVKTLVSLKAERYVLPPSAGQDFEALFEDDAAWPVKIKILLGVDKRPAHLLRLTAPMQVNAYEYRIAQVDDGLYFYISEPYVRRLLSL